MMLTLTDNPILSRPPTPPRRLAIAPISILHPRPTVTNLEAEMNRLPHLATDRRLSVQDLRQRQIDARRVKTAAQAIGQLPGDGESLHLVISGRFALCHLLFAMLDMPDCPAEQVWIATLGFSRRNVDDLCSAIDAQRIGTLHLLCSHYFAGTSAAVYDHARDQLAKRGNQAHFLSLRTHAKLLLLKMSDGRTFTVESSANLRSCKNVENAAIFTDAGLFAFHRQWLADLFADAGLT